MSSSRALRESFSPSSQSRLRRRVLASRRRGSRLTSLSLSALSLSGLRVRLSMCVKNGGTRLLTTMLLEENSYCDTNTKERERQRDRETERNARFMTYFKYNLTPAQGLGLATLRPCEPRVDHEQKLGAHRAPQCSSRHCHPPSESRRRRSADRRRPRADLAGRLWM